MLTLPNVSSHTKYRARAGLTLMELVVVMVILIALAGILLPLFPGMLTRGHTSSAATNMSELSKAVQEYYYQDLQLPNNLDNIAPLMGTGGVGIPSPANGAANIIAVAGTTASSSSSAPPTFGSAADLGVGTLGSSDLAMLQQAGIATVLQTIAPPSTVGSWTPTYNPYSANPIGNAGSGAGANYPPTTSATALASVGQVVYVNPQAAARELAQPLTGAYVLFGVGDYSSMSGKSLQTAPIHFDDSPLGEPNVVYCRFGLIFATTLDGSYQDLPAAQFVGAVDLGDSTISTIQDHVQAYLNTK